MDKTRKAFSAYLYSDGTLVQPFEDHVRGVKVGETVDITRGYCAVEIHAKCDPFGHYKDKKNRVRFGRIVLTMWCNTGFIDLARGGTVRAVMPDMRGGTQATRIQNIAVQSVTLVTRHGQELTWHEMPGVFTAVFTIEARAEKVGPLVRGDSWGDMKVCAVKDLRGGQHGGR